MDIKYLEDAQARACHPWLVVSALNTTQTQNLKHLGGYRRLTLAAPPVQSAFSNIPGGYSLNTCCFERLSPPEDHKAKIMNLFSAMWRFTKQSRDIIQVNSDAKKENLDEFGAREGY